MGKIQGNKGDIAEGIFAAAIFARFISKSKTISNEDVKKVLSRAARTRRSVSGKKTSQLYLSDKSPNKDTKIYDTVNLNIILASINMDSLLNQSYWSNELNQIFSSSVSYANSLTVRTWADELYCNRQRNTIDVIASGTEAQTMTKTDVVVLIDKQKVNINVSLKVGDVKQFGQVGGTDFEKLLVFWQVMGIDIRSLRDKYYMTMADDGVIQAFSLIFEYANGINIDTKSFADFVTYHGTLNEKGVTLVQLERDTTIYDFDRMSTFEGKVLTKLIRAADGKPKLLFTSEIGDLIVIRMKAEDRGDRPYIRTYVEKQRGLSVLLSEKAA